MTDARKLLDGIVAGLDGVTPGQWDREYIHNDGVNYWGILTDKGFICDTLNSAVVCLFRESDGGRDYDAQGYKDMAHLARCSPENLRAINNYVNSLEKEIEVLRRGGSEHDR